MSAMPPDQDRALFAGPLSNPPLSDAGRPGADATAAVLANAVADALAPLGVEPDELPLTPARVWRACELAGQRRTEACR